MKNKGTNKPTDRLVLDATANPDSDSTDRKGVQSVDKAFEILRIVDAHGSPASVTQIAATFGSSSSRVHHYLVSLVRCGALRQTGRGLYDLGPTALALGLSALGRMDTVERTCEAAQTFRDTMQESVFVSVWGNRGPATIRYFEGQRTLAVEARAGLVLPLLSSATGLVFLAWAPESKTAPFIELEGGSKTQVKKLRDSTIKEGLGRVDGDLLPRIAALSAPVFAYGEGLTLSVTVLGWSGDFDTTASGPVACGLKSMCAGLSQEFGWQSK